MNGFSPQTSRALGLYGTIGIELVLSIALGFVGGRWIDRHLGTAPWFMWIGLALGVVAAVRAFIRLAKPLKKDGGA